MSARSSHPERLLLALDEALDHEVSLILYGRSAIGLGFANPPPAAAATREVDAIIPDDQVQALADAEFRIRHEAITESQIREAFSQMKPIELAELRDAFASAKPIVSAIFILPRTAGRLGPQHGTRLGDATENLLTP
jgi:hypothetical protein